MSLTSNQCEKFQVTKEVKSNLNLQLNFPYKKDKQGRSEIGEAFWLSVEIKDKVQK